MGEGGGTLRARVRLSRSQAPSQSFPRAPELLAARAARRGTGAQREPVQGGRGTAAAAVHAAGSGCPAPGTTLGEVRAAAAGRSGTWTAR